jgi:hypothetical protein
MLLAIFQFHYLTAHLGIILFKKIELVWILLPTFPQRKFVGRNTIFHPADGKTQFCRLIRPISGLHSMDEQWIFPLHIYKIAEQSPQQFEGSTTMSAFITSWESLTRCQTIIIINNSDYPLLCQLPRVGVDKYITVCPKSGQTIVQNLGPQFCCIGKTWSQCWLALKRHSQSKKSIVSSMLIQTVTRFWG